MSMRKIGISFLLGTVLSAQAAPEGPKLGRPLAAADIAALDIDVFPDGSGLPPGAGTVEAGKTVYERQCARCHGPRGMGGTAGELAGRGALTGDAPDKAIGAYWPQATTIFDFVRRSMPLDAPRSLSDEQVYAVTAYLLFLNRIIPEEAVMDAGSLPAVRMPNREGFTQMWP